MTRRWLWPIAALVWVAAFDVQVRRAADRVTDDHVVRWHLGQAPGRLADSMGPRIRTAAYTASGLTAMLILLGLAWGQRPGESVLPRT